jgi:hypothetical protein
MATTRVSESRRALRFTAAEAASVVLLLLLPPFITTAAAAGSAGRGRSNCTRSCGNISIPYPFGIEPGCHMEGEDGFNLTCDHSHHLPKLFIGDATVRVNSSRVVFTAHGTGTWGNGLPRDGPYFLSSETTNKIAVLGCGVRVDVRGGWHDHLLGSCTAVCPLAADAGGSRSRTSDNACTGRWLLPGKHGSYRFFLQHRLKN